MTQLRGTELLELLKCQVELLYDRLERNGKAREPENVVDPLHHEVFESLDVHLFLFEV